MAGGDKSSHICNNTVIVQTYVIFFLSASSFHQRCLSYERAASCASHILTDIKLRYLFNNLKSKGNFGLRFVIKLSLLDRNMISLFFFFNRLKIKSKTSLIFIKNMVKSHSFVSNFNFTFKSYQKHTLATIISGQNNVIKEHGSVPLRPTKTTNNSMKNGR